MERSKLANLFLKCRDARIFHKNRVKSLKKKKRCANRFLRREKQKNMDFKLIKDEIQANLAELNTKRLVNKKNENKLLQLSYQIQRTANQICLRVEQASTSQIEQQNG